MSAAEFEQLRPLLFSIAYRILGSVSDAEDAVQETWLRYQQAVAGGTKPVSLKAYLTAITTRVAIDELRSARSRRESYSGQWLPEPLLTDTPGWYDDPAGAAEQADSLSMAVLLLLERLSPVQRAVFVLHDVFGYPFTDIAGIVGKTAVSCRQLAARARKHMEEGRPRFDADQTARDQLAARFFDAMGSGDIDALASMLAADAQVYGDGGGKAPQWGTVITGASRIARMCANLGDRAGKLGARIEQREVNGQPGAIFRDAQGQIIVVWSLDIADGHVAAVRSVINPDKLRHLGPVADAWALARGQSS